MPKGDARWRLVLAASAQDDIREALIWSQERFGQRAARRYRDLIKQALRDIAADPGRPGSIERGEIARGIRTYHLFFSCERVGGSLGTVQKPRHFLVYRCRGGDTIDIVRVLHDAMDLGRHVPAQ